MSQLEQVELAWRRIVAWCEQHAPDTAPALLPAADAQAIDDAERASGLSWPREMKHWYSLNNGVDWNKFDGHVLLGFMPASLNALGERQTMLLERYAEQAAGYLPIGLTIGLDCLMLDARAGSVSMFSEREARILDEPRWSSLAALLEDVAEALEQGRPAKNKQVRQRILAWTVR